MIFCRLGGLSPVRYKKGSKGFDPNGYHTPPARKGIYAFVWPYIETFLCLWDENHVKELNRKGFRYFEFNGFVWTHLYNHLPEKDIIEIKGAWGKIHTENLELALQECKRSDIRYLGTCPIFGKVGEKNKYYEPITDPYKRGRNGYMSRDHLEIFIEKSEMGKIK